MLSTLSYDVQSLSEKSDVVHVAQLRKRISGKDAQPWCLSQVCAGFHPGQSLQPCPGARSSEARVSARPPCGPSRCCCCQSARISSQRRVMLRYPTFTLERHWQCDLDRVWDLGTSPSIALSAAITSRGSHPWHRAGAYTAAAPPPERIGPRGAPGAAGDETARSEWNVDMSRAPPA